MIQKYYQQILDLYPSWRKLRCSDKPILTQTGIYIAPTWDDGYRIKFENRQAIVYQEEQYIVQIIKMDKLTPSGKKRRQHELVDMEVIFYHWDK